ncbi:MAG: cell division protein FtsQ/DivIB [Pseudomonadota bacterium]|nr:cell division protein FtsQ/DivIB [Pseudomonadota bacterium]
MWDNPDALNRISRLILAATLLFALWIVARSALESSFPFRQVTVIGANHVDTQTAARQLSRKLAGGFFSMDLHAVHDQFERLPWVREAQVRRLWPGRLVIELGEHTPAAAWNDRATLDTHGEIFPVMPWTGLPRLYAPEGMEREVTRRYGEFTALVKPMGVHVEQIVVSARLSWRVRLSGGINVELGRERLSERLARFARFYPQAVAAVGPLHRVDMRYPNGFAGEPGGQRPAHLKVETKQATKKTKQA